MTDRELLEMAAKAAGVADLECGTFGLYRVIGAHDDGTKCMVEWNPIKDDGDALRLAVKLSLCITNWPNNDPPDSMVGFVANGEYASNWYETHNGDPCKATRRAIVCAAAEIGKSITCLIGLRDKIEEIMIEGSGITGGEWLDESKDFKCLFPVDANRAHD